MKTVLWAPGTNHSLAPLTHFGPKILVPILNRPMLEYYVGQLQNWPAAQSPIILTTNPKIITHHINTAENRFLVQKISYQANSSEWIRLGQLLPFLQESLLFIDARIFAMFNWKSLYDQHKKSGALLSVIYVPFNAIKGNDALDLDSLKRLKALYKIRESHLNKNVNLLTPCYFFEPRIKSLIPSDPFLRIRDFISYLTKKGVHINAIKARGIFEPMRTLRYYVQLNFDLLKHATVGLQISGSEIQEGIFVGRRCKIKVNINENFVRPVLIGNRVKIARDVTIRGPAVIGHKVKIDKGATIDRSIVLHHTYVGKMVEVNNAVVAGNWYASVRNLYPARIEENFILHTY